MSRKAKMMQAPVAFALFLFLFGLGATKADKDDSYYVLGTGNPNIYETMYWKDAENVLQDLSQFSALYVRFHHCAWTWNQNSEDDEDVEENDYWYMGKVPPMEANVAYSLYGQLSGRSFNGCNQDTFINSFYTNSGFTAFSSAMNTLGVSGFSYSSYTAECQGGYGVGCDASGGFAMLTYASNICDPQNVTGTKNDLSYLNKAMKSVQCVKIYDKSRSSAYSNDDDSHGGAPLGLLDYSSACFYQNFFSPDGDCPDPYGKIAYYKQNFGKEIQKSKAQRPVSMYEQQVAYQEMIDEGETKAEIGAGLLAIAVLVLYLDKILFDWILPAFKKNAFKKNARATETSTANDDRSMTIQSGQSYVDDASDHRYM